MSAGTPARRGAADLPLGWASQAAVERLGTALGGTSVRATALQAFDTLPTESNLLFTGYVDLRAADLEAASLLVPPAAIGELPAGELPDGAAALIHISSRGVRVHLGTEARAVGLTVTPLAGERPLAGAASDGADACDQFAEAERLGDVVVGTHLEAEDSVELLGTRGEHDDGSFGALAQLPAHVAAVHVGQAEVEKDQVVLTSGERVDARCDVRHVESAGAEALDQ